MQKVARVDPKPILRAFMLEIQSKFPTVCGCPIKLQSKARFTVSDLLPSGQVIFSDFQRIILYILHFKNKTVVIDQCTEILLNK